MNTFSEALIPRLTVKDYFAYEQEQSMRHELVDGYLYAMTGASDRHEEIALNLAVALRNYLRNTPCRVYKGDLKIRVHDDFYYPDVFVRCSDKRGDPYFKTDPICIAEVLSPATQRYDRGDKRLAYFKLPTLKEYFLIAQDRMRVDIYRMTESGQQHEQLTMPDDVMRLEALAFEISLTDLYE